MINISLLELRMIKEKTKRYELEKAITSPSNVYEIGIKVLNMDQEPEEIFAIITLNTKNHITGVFEVSRGSINSSIVHPREVFKRAIINNAASVVLLHNHPSGINKPSKEDINITERLIEGGRILGIEILDHVIIADEGYYSFKENNLI